MWKFFTLHHFGLQKLLFFCFVFLIKTLHFQVVGESSSLYFYYGGGVYTTLYICQNLPN